MISSAPSTPADPAAPAASAAPAAPAAPIGPRVFGNDMAAIKEHEQDDTEYRNLGRMNVACSHCGALHWIEVMISHYHITILFTVTLLYFFILTSI
jgi:hypothetical protein